MTNNNFFTFPLFIILFLILTTITLFIFFLNKRKKLEILQKENKLLLNRIENFSKNSSRKIQVFARLSQILASSFSRDILLKQMTHELSSYFSEYILSIVIKREDDKIAVIDSDKYSAFAEKENIQFSDVITIASNLNKQNHCDWTSILDRNELNNFVYPFPLLTEEIIQGYLVISMKNQITPDEHLFFTDIASVLSSVVQNVLTVKEKELINDEFGRSVDPLVRDYLLKNGGEGQLLSVSVLFFDIRNFTTLSEKLGAVKSVSLLNEVFSKCDAEIKSENSFINKFTGDGFMAVFGAPLSTPNHEIQAVRAALNILEKIDLPVGIGIASGLAMAGTIGSDLRKEYTVIGDTVNTASRIEGMCKVFGSSLVISGATMEKLVTKDTGIQFTGDSRCLGKIRLKGKTEPILIYDLKTNDACPENDFSKALDAYYEKDFSKAILLLQKNQQNYPTDKAVSWYLNRALYRQQNNDTWDGVETMTEK